MTATNAPSYATELRAEQKAHEPSMEDILASIRRMIADDDALPLSRRARAAARSRIGTPDAEAAPPQKAPADGFLSLVHRLGRESGDQTDISPSPAPWRKPLSPRRRLSIRLPGRSKAKKRDSNARRRPPPGRRRR